MWDVCGNWRQRSVFVERPFERERGRLWTICVWKKNNKEDGNGCSGEDLMLEDGGEDENGAPQRTI